MNKAVIIIGIVVIAGAVFALKSFYNPSVEPKPTTVKPPTTSSSVLDRIEAAIRAKLKR